MKKRFLSTLLAFCMVLALLPGTAQAGNYWETYLAGDQTALELYRDITDWAAEVAKGGITETTVTFSNAKPQAVASTALAAAINKVMDYIFVDRPPEMYWYNSTEQYYAEYSTDGRSSWSVKFYFPVSQDYMGTYGPNPIYTVDSYKARNAWAAAARNARAIVSANAGKSDYEKLAAYRDKICELVAYNTAAWNNGQMQAHYGDPWQLIHVFDHTQPSTSKQVVCEGYAKAFQYLCDLTTFRGDVSCYTVTGSVDGEGHMWNVVRIGGKNYLVDVTACDGTQAPGSGYMPGAPDKLFLAGAAAGSGISYTCSIQDTYGKMFHFQYTYDNLTRGVYDSSVLNISRTNYDPSSAAKTYTITLNANSGTVSPASITVEAGKTYLSSLPAPTRTGYKFDGWYTDKSGGTKITSTTTATANRTLYAHWVPTAAAKTYTITLNANSGTVTPASIKVESGKTYLGLLPTPTRKGYKFDGWYTTKTGSTKITSTTKATANRTIYAHWTRETVKRTYQVYFDANGGSVYQDMKVVFPGTTYRALPIPTLSGKHFKGWYTKKSGGKKVTETTRVTLTDNQTLYAQWQTSAALKKTERGTYKVTIPAYYDLAVYATNTAAKPAATVEKSTYQTITCTQKATLSNGTVRYYGKVNNRNYWFTYSCEMEVR